MTIFKTLLLVGLGGFVGSAGRYLTDYFISKLFNASYPWGTFVVNLIGCFLIGILLGAFAKDGWFTMEWKMFFVTGFCGGFTTFSTFAADNLKLLDSGDYLNFGIYTLASVFVGILFVWIGLLLTKI